VKAFPSQISANDFADTCSTDGEMIQSAVDLAAQHGIEAVVPRFNARTGRAVWVIERSVLLPCETTLVIDNAHLRMADLAVCNMFRNRNAGTPEGNSEAGTQRGIRIIGRGGALLDGGEPNGLNEFTSGKDGRPHVTENLTLYMHNVIGFSVETLRIRDPRWWAMAFMFCESGRIERIEFELTRHRLDSHQRWRNQDGIDLRIGCSNILIRDISGEVGDDLIALTALSAFEKQRMVEGRSTDIHHVMIQSIRGVTNMCALVRLLNHSRHKIHDIQIRDVMEVSRPGIENKAQMAIRIGDGVRAYFLDDDAQCVEHGEIFNIHVENVHTRALTAISTSLTIKNFTARNIFLAHDAQHAWVCGDYYAVPGNIFIYLPERQSEVDANVLTPGRAHTVAENVRIENVFHSAESAGVGEPKALFRFFNAELKNVAIENVCSDRDVPLILYEGECSGEARIERAQRNRE